MRARNGKIQYRILKKSAMTKSKMLEVDLKVLHLLTLYTLKLQYIVHTRIIKTENVHKTRLRMHQYLLQTVLIC